MCVKSVSNLQGLNKAWRNSASSWRQSRYEGAINFAGLGQPLAEDLEKPLACFQGHTASSFLQLIDNHLQDGYPSGDNETEVPEPFHDLKAHAADATCVFMYTVKYLMEEEGKTIDDIRRLDEETYRSFLSYIKTQIDFDGVSGRVKFDGNDTGRVEIYVCLGPSSSFRQTLETFKACPACLSRLWGPWNGLWASK